MVSLLDFINSISYDIQDVSARIVGGKVDLLSTRGEVVRPVRLRTPPWLYIYYEIVHKVHNKKKMKKRQGKNKNTK